MGGRQSEPRSFSLSRGLPHLDAAGIPADPTRPAPELGPSVPYPLQDSTFTRDVGVRFDRTRHQGPPTLDRNIIRFGEPVGAVEDEPGSGEQRGTHGETPNDADDVRRERRGRQARFLWVRWTP